MTKKPKKPTRRLPPIRAAVAAYLVSAGFQQVGEPAVTKDTTRYVSHRGIPDGDFPNAHQSIHTRTVTEWWRPRSGDAEVAALIKALEAAGLSGQYSKYSKAWDYVRGSHWVRARFVRNTLVVTHQSETAAPDLAFERSGRGIGQII